MQSTNWSTKTYKKGSKSFVILTYSSSFSKAILFDWFSGSNLPSYPWQGSWLVAGMATFRSTVDQWREGFRKVLILAVAGRISKETCISHPRWEIRNGPDLMPLNCEHYLYRQMHATPETLLVLKFGHMKVIEGRNTLSLKPSCCPALSQRRAGTRVNRSVKHSDVRSVPVMSNSWSWVFSHSTACTCSLNNPSN